MSDVMPGAEPWSSLGGPVGVLVVHGFTGTPQSMRPLAEAFAAAGMTVEMPLLPGHGTSVEDMIPTRWSDWSQAAERACTELEERCEQVVVVGLSMGGTLTVWLATRHPGLAGIVCVNPFVDGHAPGITATSDIARTGAQETLPAIGSDISMEGAEELAYPATPAAALVSLVDAARKLERDLADIACPVLLMTSPEDHVVENVSSDLLARSVSGPVTRITLERSFHVATLDHDAALIEESSVAFVREVSAR